MSNNCRVDTVAHRLLMPACIEVQAALACKGKSSDKVLEARVACKLGQIAKIALNLTLELWHHTGLGVIGLKEGYQ